MAYWGYNEGINEEPLSNDPLKYRRPGPSFKKRLLVAIIYLAAVAAFLSVMAWLN